MSAELATKHRAAVARVVYLAQDPFDLGVAAIEFAKTTAIPIGDDERLKRVAQYLMVILTTCDVTQFRKRRKQLF